jgi:hypothetical protein
MNSKLKKILVSLVCLAMLAGLATVFTVSAEEAEGGLAYGWIENDNTFRIEVFNKHGLTKVGDEVIVEEGNTLEVTFTVAGFTAGSYTAALGTSHDWAFGGDSPHTVEVTGNGTFTIETSWEEDAEITDVFVIDIDFENPDPGEAGPASASDVSWRVLDADGEVVSEGVAAEIGAGGEEEIDVNDPNYVPPASEGVNYAWLAGTFYPFDGDAEVDWQMFTDKKVAWTPGTAFTVTIDMGDEKIEYDVADWEGHVLCVQTNLTSADAERFTANVASIKVDGVEVEFDSDMFEVSGSDRGMRIEFSSSWANPQRLPISAFGEFSKLEVEMTFIEGEAGDGTNTGDGNNATGDEEEDDDGIPVWVWIAIGGGVVLLIIIIAVVAKKKR